MIGASAALSLSGIPFNGPIGAARGETQSLTSVTLGTKLDEKIIDDVLAHGKAIKRL